MSPCARCGATLNRPSAYCPACGANLSPGALATVTSTVPLKLLGHGTASFGGARFAPGQMIGDRYRIVSLIGHGGMGDVYRADDLRLGEPVALKFLPETVERDPARLQRLMAEVRTARQVSHSYVCRVHDIGEVDGHRFLSMEYIDGEDLDSLLRRIGKLPDQKALQIAREICVGLSAMHEKEVLHRDLKPANVMVDGRGRARITDFGVAAAIDATQGEIAGTPAYMSPEQRAGKPLSVQSDLYALGLLLFEVFTGERVTKVGVSEQSTAGPCIANSITHLDPAVQRVIEQCLEPDPLRRPSSALAVGMALPGADPLAAALAAGQTPSPETVADAGAAGYLSPRVAIPCLIAVIVGVALFAWAEARRIHTGVAPFPYSPAVLSVKAQELLTRLGYRELPQDSAYGFTRSHLEYSTWMNRQTTSDDRWRHATSIKPPIVRFWYRGSPKPMTPRVLFSGAVGGGMTISLDDPPLDTPGMSYIELSPHGHLVNLHMVLPRRDASNVPPAAPDWSQLFEEAGLDYARFTAVTPEWLPSTMCDTRAAWTGPGADPAGAQLRVEAAAYMGRPVFFRLVGPWTLSEQLTFASTVSRLQRGLMLSGNILFVGVLAATIGLALRNIRRGRADRRGATRLAIGIGCVGLSAAALGSHYALTADDLLTFASILSRACYVAMFVWIAYTALEPYVRRRRPEMLIGWTRVLDGRWRDPLVGRALLVGSVLGILRLLILDFQELALERQLPRAEIGAWTGLPSAVAALLDTLPSATLVSSIFIVFLVLLRILLRSELVAALVVVVLFTVLFSHHVEAPREGILFTILGHLVLALFSGLVLIAARLGLLTLFVSYVVMYIGPALSVSLPHPNFLRATVVLGLASMLAPGIVGFYTSTRLSPTAAKWLD